MDVFKTMAKFKSKSTKDKARNLQPAHDHSISGPSTRGSEGLYLKLTNHQKKISTHMKFFSSVVDGGKTKSDLTTVVTHLLMELNGAVTTSHQCLNKDVFEKNEALKPRLDSSEKTLYTNVALLVKWADFGEDGPPDVAGREALTSCISSFESALTDIVKLIAECLLVLTPDSSFRERMHTQEPYCSTLDPVQFATLRIEGTRKTSLPASMMGSHTLSPHSSSPPNSHLLFDKAASLRPSMLRDSIHSESSASDEERRRSGSVERATEHSPEHLRSGQRDLMSPERDSRYRSHTTPTHRNPAHAHSLSTPVPVPTPTVPSTSPPISDRRLPPLPGEEGHHDAPPLPPRRQDSGGGLGSDSLFPPVPPRKGHTLPRASTLDATHINGRYSPEFATGARGSDELPPPLPIKKKKQQQQQQHNGHSPGRSHYDDVPPPLPVKQRRKAPSVSSPTSSLPPTPTHIPPHTPLSHSQREPGPMAKPLVPLRIESIPGLKNALETPPPKPPRTDRPANQTQPQAMPHTPHSEVAEAINAMRRYNKDIMQGAVGPDVAPPIPLKKKSLMRYKELLCDYTFDDTMMQKLYIPGMAEPPPLPPKRRLRRKLMADSGQLPSTGEAAMEGVASKVSNGLSSSVEDMYSEDADIDSSESNYLECEETSGYLIFNKEDDGGYTLRGGHIDALIAYSASTTTSVQHFTEAFLLTFYTVITPEDLISKLLYRLNFFYRLGNHSVWQSTNSILVRVLNSLHQPLVKVAEIQLIDMVHQMISDGNLKFAQLLRNALVTKLNQLIPDQTKFIPIGRALSSPNRKLLILDFSPDDIARQMTVLDNELFQKVDVSEMLYWAAEQNEEKSPQLTQFTMHFNNVSQWTKTRILEHGLEMKMRIKIMHHFIAIMKFLRGSYNNFNSYLAVLSAIESSPVSRLDWPEKIIKGLEEPRALIDNRGSFKNYRLAFAQAKPPCIPYIGLYLQDLTFIEMQPSKLEDGVSINFTKRWKQFKSVDHIRFSQTRQYNYTPDPDILSLFSNFEIHLSDDELWTISHEIKASGRAQRASQQPA